LPLVEAGEAVLNGKATWYRDWLAKENPADPYWDVYRHDAALTKSNVPILLFGGWHDIFLEQTMEQYRVLHGRGANVALTIGPWAHLDTIGKGSGPITRETLDWLDEHLAGREQARRRQPVRIFVTGANHWRDFAEWPPATRERSYHLDQDS